MAGYEKGTQGESLPPGLYTAILSGVNSGEGVGIVEVYDRGP
ncbi:MAG TPA: hypothetical protein VE031_07730 [Chthoniobacterales bacterium]|nr:hypothetical protein [Chthoniobacterales bacterium]